MSLNKRKYLLSLCLTFIFLIPIFIFNVGWNFDDTGYWLYIFKNNNISLSYFNNDRFAPFNTISTKLISLLSFKPVVFFLYNFLLAFLSFSILLYITLKSDLKTWFFPIIIIFTAGFSTTFYRIYHGERELFFLWAVFIFISFQSINFKYQIEISNSIYFTLIPINVTLYYKETSVILLALISLFTLFVLIKNSNKYFQLSIKNKKILLNLLILYFLSIIIYIYLYTKYTTPIYSDSYYNKLVPNNSIYSRLNYSIKSLFLFSISDFLIFIFLPSISLFLNYLRIKKLIILSNINKLYLANILFFISLFFTISYVLLGIHSNYYLLPVYPFSILSLCLYIDLFYELKLIRNKIILYVLFPIIIINSINSSINEIIFLRISSKNFMNYQFRLNYILNQDSKSNISNNAILFLGVNDITYYENIQNCYLKFYDISTNNVKILSSIDFENKGKPKFKIYFIVTPNSNENKLQINNRIKSLGLKNIFRTSTLYYFELPELRHIVKYFMIKFNKSSIQSPNIYREVDFEIYTNF
jgi:hypothetical protein